MFNIVILHHIDHPIHCIVTFHLLHLYQICKVHGVVIAVNRLTCRMWKVKRYDERLPLKEKRADQTACIHNSSQGRFLNVLFVLK